MAVRPDICCPGRQADCNSRPSRHKRCWPLGRWADSNKRCSCRSASCSSQPSPRTLASLRDRSARPRRRCSCRSAYRSSRRSPRMLPSRPGTSVRCLLRRRHHTQPGSRRPLTRCAFPSCVLPLASRRALPTRAGCDSAIGILRCRAWCRQSFGRVALAGCRVVDDLAGAVRC